VPDYWGSNARWSLGLKPPSAFCLRFVSIVAVDKRPFVCKWLLSTPAMGLTAHMLSASRELTYVAVLS